MDDFAKAPFTRSTQNGTLVQKPRKYKVLGKSYRHRRFRVGESRFHLSWLLASWSAERDSSVRVAVKAKPAA
jgi:hypothetical protein